jgi:cobalt/nickel transport system ATP-binding protein
MSPVLELENVSFSFDGKTDVLSDISLRIDQGEKVGLVGGNGAGKSTLLWCALGLLHHRGTVRLFGQKRNAESLCHTGVVFQNPEDQLFMPSISDDLMLPLLNRGMTRESARSVAQEVIRQVNLGSLSEMPARHLSLGQRKRAAIAAALVNSPESLVLDEPTAELDARSRREVGSLLASYPIALLIASHDLAFLQRLVDRVLVLDQGRMMADLTSTEFFNDISLQEELGLI